MTKIDTALTFSGVASVRDLDWTVIDMSPVSICVAILGGLALSYPFVELGGGLPPHWLNAPFNGLIGLLPLVSLAYLKPSRARPVTRAQDLPLAPIEAATPTMQLSETRPPEKTSSTATRLIIEGRSLADECFQRSHLQGTTISSRDVEDMIRSREPHFPDIALQGFCQRMNELVQTDDVIGYTVASNAKLFMSRSTFNAHMELRP